MFNKITVGSRFKKDNEVYTVVKVISGNFFQLKERTTKEIHVYSFRDLEKDFHSLDDYVSPEEEQMYLSWAKDIMKSPTVIQALDQYHQTQKLEKLL